MESYPAPSPISSRSAEARTHNVTKWALLGLKWILVICLPALFLLTSVRVVMTELYLQAEYRRPGFPEDTFGFTMDDRLTLAPYAIEYLLNDADIDYLGDLTFDSGEPLYNERELGHMEDVKVVTRAAFAVHTGISIFVLATVLILASSLENRILLRSALFEGGLLTLTLIAGLVVLMLASWDTFFTNFHKVFFKGNTWLFRRSDTLIRLFPEQFWFDAALTIGVMTITGAVLAIVTAVLWGRRTNNTLRA